MSKQEREELKRLLNGGLQPPRTVGGLWPCGNWRKGKAIRRVAANLGLTPKTVWW